MSVRTSNVTVDGLRGFLAQPDEPTPAGMLVLPTIAGINSWLEDYCRSVARDGIAALAWDPFSAYPADTPQQERMQIALSGKLQDGATQTEQVRWLDYMERELGLRHMGTSGFCMGGRMVMLLADRDPRIQAVQAFHPTWTGQSPEIVAAAARLACPVQVFYPGKDHLTSHETYAAVRDALEARPSAATICHIYPEADHGYLSRTDTPANTTASALTWPQASGFLQAALLGL